MLKIDLPKEKKERLRKARNALAIAATLIYGAASGVEPFHVSKFLNILGKEADQLARELSIFLGEIEMANDPLAWDSPKQPSLLILQTLAEDLKGVLKSGRG